MSDFPEFDHGKARRVIEELTATIRVLNQQTHDRVNNARTMRQSWKGRHADRFFNTEMPRIQSEAERIIQHMRTIINAVNGADAAAAEAKAQWQRRHPQPTPIPGPRASPAPWPSFTPSPQPGPAPTPRPTPRG
jgi:uncharacterized protein YukE